MKKRSSTLIVAALATLAVIVWIVVDEPREDLAEVEMRRFHALEPLAEKGDVDAQFALGELYRKGKGVDGPEDGRPVVSKGGEKRSHGRPPCHGPDVRERPGGQKECFKWRPSGTGWRPASAAMAKPNSTSAPSTLTAVVFRTITPRRSNGTARRPARATLRGAIPCGRDGVPRKARARGGPCRSLCLVHPGHGQGRRGQGAQSGRYDPVAARDKLSRKMTHFQIGRAEKKMKALMAGR